MVAGAWTILLVLVTLLWPPLTEVIQQQSTSPLPTQSASVRAMADMGKAFNEEGADNSIVVGFESDLGYSPAADQVRAGVVEDLRSNPHVRGVRDLVSDPRTRDAAMSEDKHAWFVTAEIAGGLASPEGIENVDAVRKSIAHWSGRNGVEVVTTGPAATFTDQMKIGNQDLTRITIATVIGIATILLIIYRSLFTAIVPLITVGISVGVGSGILAGMGVAGVPVNTQSEALLVVVTLGAGVDYAVFYLGRYHEYIRSGIAPEQAVVSAAASMGRVIAASAGTVAIASLAMLTADLAGLMAIGPAVALAVVCGFLSAMTLMPILLSLGLRRGWGLPAADRTLRAWRRTGVFVARRPVIALTASLVLLLSLAGWAVTLHPSYDDRKMLPASAESNVGYSMLDRHFPQGAFSPQYLLVQSESDLRTPGALADLEQMAARISQIEGIRSVSGVTRPDAKKLTQATLARLLGQVGAELGRTGASTDALTDTLDRYERIATLGQKLVSNTDPNDILAALQTAEDTWGEVNSAKSSLDSVQQLISQADSISPVLAQLETIRPHVKRLVDAVNSTSAASTPLLVFLDRFAPCSSDSRCVDLRGSLRTAVTLADSPSVAALTNGSLSSAQIADALTRARALSSSAREITRKLDQIAPLVARIPEIRATVEQLRDAGAFDPTNDPESIVADVRQRLARGQEMMGSVSAALKQVSSEASGDSASGFYLPQEVLTSPEFSTVARMFVSPDGHSVRYLIESSIDQYDSAAMTQAREIMETATAALPNTNLTNAHVKLAGFPAINSDLQEMFQRDFLVVVIVTLSVVAFILMVIVRSVAVPIYLVATVLLTYASAIGVGVLVFQDILGWGVNWVVPALSFILLVAVGADYNLLLVSRIREEMNRSMRASVIRTVGATGSVITSAGVIFAVSMFAMMAGNLKLLAEFGFIIGIGLLLDTLIVRPLVVPSILVLRDRYARASRQSSSGVTRI
ncbi:MMPL family transporter [Gordonia malaquae]|uniref:MMPL family transporter n=1 Tax=Gordonia malaquae TaxID=410332 RepID=UPI0030FE4EF4